MAVTGSGARKVAFGPNPEGLGMEELSQAMGLGRRTAGDGRETGVHAGREAVGAPPSGARA